MGNYVTTTRLDTENGSVCRVTITNERKLNTLGSEAVEELRAIFEDLKNDKTLRVVILTGAGQTSFIGGANINEMAKLNPDTARQFITNLHTVVVAIRTLHVPVIARINGLCLGAGMEIAAICDIIVAEETAQFAMPEVHIGLPSVIEAAVLPQIIGVGLARDLVMTGRTLSGKEAHQANFVQRLAAPGKLDEATELVTQEILKAGPKALSIQKELCNAWEEQKMTTSVQLGIDAFAKSFETDEPTKMLSAFVNRPR